MPRHEHASILPTSNRPGEDWGSRGLALWLSGVAHKTERPND